MSSSPVTKATGRGRGWRRKQWADLAPSTQKRYLRIGIDAPRHARGDSPRLFYNWLGEQERKYRWEHQSGAVYTYTVNGEEHIIDLNEYDRGDLMDAIRYQKDMERAYESGDTVNASALWAGRNTDLPDWLLHYHGVFS